MKIVVRLLLLVVCLASSPGIARAEWQAVEKVQTYTIAGKSGADLYASIGENGPKVGGLTRTIAHTNFKLTWSRKYEAQGGGACTLVSARPKLVITYTLPEPAGQLPPAAAKNWETFIAGVRSHEVVHGEMIKDMVQGNRVRNRGYVCAGRPQMPENQDRVDETPFGLSLAQRQRSRDFDRTELSKGGNIHQLILALVNGS